MNAVSARRSGVPTNPVRALSLVLAALASAIPLLMLLYGLSVRTIEAMRQMPILVQLLPEPQPTPEIEQPHPSRARRAEHAAAPAPAAPQRASPVDQSQPILPQPVPMPLRAPISASGQGVAPAAGTGGNGSGGSGSGPIGGTAPLEAGASWVTKPGTADLLPFNPPRARIENVNGQILLTCRVLRSRVLADCRVAAERPRGYGFGNAALQAARTFRFNPPTINGQPDEARRIEIPVAFNNRR